MAKILVACEYSGKVRDAFIKKGHHAISCDLLDTEQPGPHHKGDVFDILYDEWDVLIAHPPCTYNALSGIRWMYHPEDTHLPPLERRRHPNYPNRFQDFLKYALFFNKLKNAVHIKKRCIENSIPHGLAKSLIGQYTQIIQPYQFGEPYSKATALWLEGLPPLVPTHKKEDFNKIEQKCFLTSPNKDRWKERSRTYDCIAEAMANAWG